MAASRLRRTVLGTTVVAGLGLLGTGAAGVLALDRDIRAAEQQDHPRLLRDVRGTPSGAPCDGDRHAPRQQQQRQPQQQSSARQQV
jgi:hypothetical protein